MELWAIVRRRLVALAKRRQLERDLKDEMAFHLAMRERALRSQGMGEREAAQASRRAFGNATLLTETTREVWMFRWLEDLGHDLRFGWRQLRKTPGFALIAILSLAIGIGATTAVFSIVYATLLHPYPF